MRDHRRTVDRNLIQQTVDGFAAHFSKGFILHKSDEQIVLKVGAVLALARVSALS